MNKLAKPTLHSLINIRTCKIRVVHGSFQSWEFAPGWSLKGIMKSAHWILHNSPARTEGYTSVTGSSIYPFNFNAWNLLKRSATLSLWSKEMDLKESVIKLKKKLKQQNRTFLHLKQRKRSCFKNIYLKLFCLYYFWAAQSYI